MAEEQQSNAKIDAVLNTDNIPKSIAILSLPMMATGFSDALYNMVDSIFVGRFVGEKALAAVSINNSISILLLSMSALYGSGINSIMSRALGAKNYEKVNQTIVNGFFLALFSTLVVSVLLLSNINKLLLFIGSPEEVLSYSRAYGQIVLLFGFLLPSNAVLNGMLRAGGQVKKVMVGAFIGALLNIVLDALFIVGFKWGIRGAAYATILTQFVVCVYLFTNVQTFYKLRFHAFYLKYIKKPFLTELYSVGFPGFVRTLTFSVVSISANRSLSLFGAESVAAFGIVMRIMHLAYQPIFGSNLGTQALIGYNYGANQFLKVKSIITTGIVMATIVGFIPTLLLVSAPEFLFRLFTQSESIILIADEASRIAGLTFFFYGFQIFSTGALVAMGHPQKALILSIFRPLVMATGMNVMPIFLQRAGVWWTFPITDILSSILTAIVLVHEFALLKRKEENLRKIY